MRRFAVGVGLLIITCGIPAAAQQSRAPETKAPQSIFGIYRPSGKARTLPSRNSIRITPVGQAKVKLTLKLDYANGHTCQLDQDGSWQGNHLLVVADGLNPTQACQLEARFSGTQIHLTDKGQHCANVYCGTRGKLDGVVLSKSRR